MEGPEDDGYPDLDGGLGQGSLMQGGDDERM